MESNIFVFDVFHISFCDPSQREPEEAEDATKGRDVFNEKPPADELMAVSDIGKSVTTSLPDSVVSTFYVCLKFYCRITKSINLRLPSSIKMFLILSLLR